MLFRLGRSHDARVNEWRGHVGDLRVFGIAGDHNGDAMRSRQRDEVGALEAFVADLDGVADGEAIDR